MTPQYARIRIIASERDKSVGLILYTMSWCLETLCFPVSVFKLILLDIFMYRHV